MASVSKNSTSAADNGGGSSAWSPLANISSAAGTVDYFNSAGDGVESSYLKIYFGLTTSDVPSGATIDGIQFTLNGCNGDSPDVKDYGVFLVKAGVVQTLATNKYNNTRWRNIHTQTYGGNSNVLSTWGVAITDSDVRHANFGIGVSCVSADGDGIYVDYAIVTIWYTAAGGGGGSTTQPASSVMWC